MEQRESAVQPLVAPTETQAAADRGPVEVDSVNDTTCVLSTKAPRPHQTQLTSRQFIDETSPTSNYATQH